MSATMSLGPAVLVQHLGPAGGGQRSHLLGFVAKIDRSRSQFQVKVDRLPLQFAYLEFHGMSLKHIPGRRGEIPDRVFVCRVRAVAGRSLL